MREEVKDIILKYAPIVEDRLNFLGDTRESKTLEIVINPDQAASLIYFMYGNQYVLSQTKEKVYYNGLIDEQEVISIIDFIVNDMDLISGFNIDDNKIRLRFNINWSNKTVSGMSCNQIIVVIDFEQLKDDLYKHNLLKEIAISFGDYLKNCHEFKKYVDDYLNKDKIDYFKNMSREELIEAVNLLDEENIRELLLKIDNEDYYNYFYAPNKIKKLNK